MAKFYQRIVVVMIEKVELMGIIMANQPHLASHHLILSTRIQTRIMHKIKNEQCINHN